MPAPITVADHNHDLCQADALARAEAVCLGRGVRLTPIRRQVLSILWQSHRPASAYEVLHQLNDASGMNDAMARNEGRGEAKDGIKRPLAPPAVYRALDFLLSQGLAHRLASLNAYVGCVHPERAHGAQFFICRHCQAVIEVRDTALAEGMQRVADQLGFAMQAPLVEVTGICAACMTA